MTLELNSYKWASTGIQPINEEDAIYTAGEQPIAGYDNNIMWKVTDDLHTIRDWVVSHGSEHESGGPQEINLNELMIGSQGQLVSDGNVVYLADSGGNPVLRYNNNSNGFTAIAEIRDDLRVRDELILDDDIEDYAGDTLYDSTADRFHRAFHANEADVADLALDSNLLEGFPASAFIRPDDEEVTITGEWTSVQPMTTDIHGHASTASFASVAAFADEAEIAFLANDSELLEGFTVQEILDMIDMEGALPAVQDDGETQVQNAATLDMGESIDVTPDGTTARMDVHSVPHSIESNISIDSHLHEGLTVSEILELVDLTEGAWTKIDNWSFNHGDWELDVNFDETFDRYKVIVRVENNSGSTFGLVWCRINGDSRQRYSFYKLNYGSSGWGFIEETRNLFWMCATDPGYMNTAEYVINCPEPVVGDVNNYPTFGVNNTGGYRAQTGGQVQSGRLETDSNEVHRLTFWPRQQVAAEIAIYGQNLP